MEHFAKNRMILLVIVIITIAAATIGMLIGFASCIPAAQSQTTFSAAWSLYGSSVAVVVFCLALLAVISVLLFAGINALMDGTGPKNDHYR
jgi:hypothetical protein